MATKKNKKSNEGSLHLKDSLNDQLFQQLQSMKKELKEKETEKTEKEREQKIKEKREREKNKSFEELLAESNQDWKQFK
ncbi:YqkE family protein [Metabacillus arenae]|uniref:YqkE family protein n=1 Tax=Metabacillus arenae TaxID=2771434 RepID=A0A926RVE5_9BACI|nr:YqkE family protein [Metabacillus arenae]MBD1378721.1 YqkE family protein [Metabacillus arenae]